MSLRALAKETWPDQARRFEEMLGGGGPWGSQELTAAVRAQVVEGGKRLRAALPVAVCQALTGSPTWDDPQGRAALQLGLGCELLHSGTLCHDDVMDGDTLRRGAPTIWVRHGVPQAINAGDMLFQLGTLALAAAPLDGEARLRVVVESARALRRVIDGQALEIELRRASRLPTLEDYSVLSRGKTGGLFALCMVSGGLAAGAPAVVVEDLDRVGLELGELFQVQDDVLDLVGDKGRGDTGNDLREGKPSWLIACASSGAAPGIRAQLARDLYQPREEKTDACVERLRAAIDASGAVDEGLTLLTRRRLACVSDLSRRHPGLGSLVDGILADFYAPLRAWL